MKKIILIILLVSMIAIVNADLVYQENSDSQLCSGSWNVSYPCSNTYDGNWATYGKGFGISSVNVLFNYSIPANATNSGSLWRVKDEKGNANLTIPSGCWLKSPIQYQLIITPLIIVVAWQCLNQSSSAYITLRTAGRISSANAYEEGMYWNENCWTKTGNVLFIPNGCVYPFNQGTSYLIG